MKRFLTMLIAVVASAITVQAQNYTVTGAGTGKGGNYLVTVKVNVKRANMKSEDAVLEAAVDAAMFYGFMNVDGSSNQPPLIKDPNVKDTKADFFSTFEREGAYRRYATIVPGSLSVAKNKKLKCKEVTAKILINQATLRKYLEDAGVIAGFSNLW